jgi:hypothetical protein
MSTRFVSYLEQVKIRCTSAAGIRSSGGRVEEKQRLVTQQQPRLSGQGLGDPQPLLLPAGQQPDRRVRVVQRADRRLGKRPYGGGRVAAASGVARS